MKKFNEYLEKVVSEDTIIQLKSPSKEELEIIGYLEDAIIKYKEALKILNDNKHLVSESMDIFESAVVWAHFDERMQEANHLLDEFVKSIKRIAQESERDKSIELFVFGKQRLIGGNTNLTYPSSLQEGENIRSLLIEMINMKLDELQQVQLATSVNQFRRACGIHNKAVEKYKNVFIIKEYEDIIISIDKMLTDYKG